MGQEKERLRTRERVSDETWNSAEQLTEAVLPGHVALRVSLPGCQLQGESLKREVERSPPLPTPSCPSWEPVEHGHFLGSAQRRTRQVKALSSCDPPWSLRSLGLLLEKICIILINRDVRRLPRLPQIYREGKIKHHS